MTENANPAGLLRVLVVDDEPDFLEVLVKRLSKRNLLVVPAASGRAALDVLSREAFDAVVLDLNMPGISGMETLAEIKKTWPSMEVIILTGRAEVQLALKGMQTGAFDYLLKPPDVDELVYKIQDASARSPHNSDCGKCPE
jgi:DNA-binding response OmpR family regulator